MGEMGRLSGKSRWTYKSRWTGEFPPTDKCFAYWTLFHQYSKTSADFTIDRQYTIEVGGHSKDGKQIAGQPNSYIAAADEEYVLGNKIPLWLFGFLY